MTTTLARRFPLGCTFSLVGALAVGCEADDFDEPGSDAPLEDEAADEAGEEDDPNEDSDMHDHGDRPGLFDPVNVDDDSWEIGVDERLLADEPIPPAEAQIVVGSLSALKDALANAKPGHEIVVKSGTTLNLSSTLSIPKSGTSSARIVIRAETPGSVTISGSAGLSLSGRSYVTISGFVFTHKEGSVGLKMNDCKYIRLTRNTFRMASTSGTVSHWVSISGSSSGSSGYNRIDHNRFETKKSEGNFIRIIGNPVSQKDRIDWNFFYKFASTGGTSGEAVRVGGSVNSRQTAGAVIENNLFEECNGDSEVISIKSVGNFVRWNTFKNNAGSITLRHGNGTTVDGNFFLGGSNGIRLYGHDHRIVNNYFEANSGTGVRSTLILGSGDTSIDPDGTSHAKYSQAKNVTVAFNTLVDNATHLVVGYGDRSYEPLNCNISYNIIKGNSGTLVRVYDQSSTTWTKNILHGSASTGQIPSGGYTRTDPKHSRRANDNILRLASDSPAIDKVSSWPSFVIDDSDGQARSGSADIGADERSNASVVRRRLLRSDVGPDSNGGGDSGGSGGGTTTTVFSDDFSSDKAWREFGDGNWLRKTDYLEATNGYTGALPVLHADQCPNECRIHPPQRLDLTGAKSATLRFQRVIDDALESGEYLKLDLYDGSSWTTVKTWGPGDDTWSTESIELPAKYWVATFDFRFKAKMDRADEDVQIDDVAVIVTR